MINHEQIEHHLSSIITLRELQLLVLDIPQKEVFKSAIGKRESRVALIVKWVSEDGVEGFGECSCRPDPFYSHEFVSGAIKVIKEFIFPLLAKKQTYKELLEKISKIRGWNFTKAAIEFAANDVLRRQTGVGLIEASGLAKIEKVPVGISLGMFDSVNSLENKLTDLLDSNYQRLKFKISPSYNNDKIIKYLSELEHSNISFDANGSFVPGYFEILEKYAALWYIIEQPFPPGELYLYQKYVKDHQEFRICLDEDIESYGNLVSMGLHTDEVNIKPGRVGGLFNTLRMIDYTNKHAIKTWIGGMFETGIGRAQNLQIASLLPDAKAHDLSPSSRYFKRDVVKNPITMENGFVDKSTFEKIDVDESAIEEMLVERIILK
ncbi:MAG: o-succinylbenzoate synthase [Bacteroidota bacterium]